MRTTTWKLTAYTYQGKSSFSQRKENEAIRRSLFPSIPKNHLNTTRNVSSKCSESGVGCDDTVYNTSRAITNGKVRVKV